MHEDFFVPISGKELEELVAGIVNATSDPANDAEGVCSLVYAASNVLLNALENGVCFAKRKEAAENAS